MPNEYEFRESPPSGFDQYPTKWLVRERAEGAKTWGRWRRLHCTPKGHYFLAVGNRKRAPYNGPAPS